MIERWLAAPAPPTRLAAMRILIGVFALVYLAVRFPVMWALGDEPPGEWAPIGVLWWLDEPLPQSVVRALLLATTALSVLYAAGRAYRVTGPLFAVSLLALTTYRSSGGQLLWFDNLLVLHALVIGFAPAADGWVLHRVLRRDRDDAPSTRYGWPLRLAAIVTVVTYALAGIAKLRIGGDSWFDGDSLRNHIAYSATRLRVLGGSPSPLAEPMIAQRWLLPLLAVATLVIELGAPLVLVIDRLRWWWIAATWSMHLAIAATMFVVFPYPLALVAFAPLVDLQRIPARVQEWRHRARQRPQ